MNAADELAAACADFLEGKTPPAKGIVEMNNALQFLRDERASVAEMANQPGDLMDCAAIILEQGMKIITENRLTGDKLEGAIRRMMIEFAQDSLKRPGEFGVVKLAMETRKHLPRRKKFESIPGGLMNRRA